MAAPAPHQPYDTAWKNVLDEFFPDFTAFCLPELHALIDWSRPWQSLDKELQTLNKGNDNGRRFADKLFKVFLKSGEETWLLVHIECQNEKDETLPKRMFVYGYRIYDKYDVGIVSCAILADGDPEWRPDSFTVGRAGSSLGIKYLAVKLTDYAGKLEELKAASNPFALVAYCHLEAAKARGNSATAQLEAKITLTKLLYRKKFSKRQITNLYLFIDWLLHLPADLELQYQETIHELEEGQGMAYISSFERFGIEKGRQEGVLQGRQEGRQEGVLQGRQEGRQEGERKILLKLLKLKFRVVPQHYQSLLKQAGEKQLLRWSERVLTATTLEELFNDQA